MKDFIIFSLLITFSLFIITNSIEKTNTQIDEDEEEIIELIDPETIPKKDDPNYFYIAILHSNDIHGSFYPKKIELPSGQTYSIGGLEYLGKYVSILQEEWGDQFLYFDSGDHFQGGIEGFISKGQIIMDYFKQMKLKNSAIGNHDFDYGMDFIRNYLNSSSFDFLAANLLNTTTMEYNTFPNQKRSAIYDMGNGIKIGIIGLITKETLTSTKTDMEDLSFEDYDKIIYEQTNELKQKGANAIIVLGHLGLNCNNDSAETKYKYLLRNKNTSQKECSPTEEASVLLNSLKPNTIDLFLAGHKHEVVHHWINNIPIVSNERNGKYAEIIYLPFDRKTKKLVNEKIQIEGPLPICEKIFKNKKICDLSVISPSKEEEYGPLSKYSFHKVQISKNEKVEKIGEQYLPIFNEYDKDILTTTKDHFDSSRYSENNLGDFYTDFLRQVSGAQISVINSGTFRTPLYRGVISNATIQSFDPFGNKLVMFKAYGYEIKKIFKSLQEGKKGYYPFSGLKMVVKDSPSKKLISIKYFDGNEEKEIIDNELYSIASNNFCFPIEGNEKGGDDFYSLGSWFKPREGKYLFNGEINTRDAFIDFLRNIDELKSSKYYDENNLRMRIIENI